LCRALTAGLVIAAVQCLNLASFANEKSNPMPYSKFAQGGVVQLSPVSQPSLRPTGFPQKWQTHSVGPACAAVSAACTHRSHTSWMRCIALTLRLLSETSID
jgi:hypothetical protein